MVTSNTDRNLNECQTAPYLPGVLPPPLALPPELHHLITPQPIATLGRTQHCTLTTTRTPTPGTAHNNIRAQHARANANTLAPNQRVRATRTPRSITRA